MINFMLNNLCRPTGEVFGVCFHFKSLKLYFDSFILFALTGAAIPTQPSL